MKKLIVFGLALLAVANPLEAQLGGRLAIEPYVAYGFFGRLPENATLEADVAFGGRLGVQLASQWGLFGNFQRSTPEVMGSLPGFQGNIDHWSAGIEFSYVPRGGAEGMLPVLLEAGVGQARYAGLTSDLAVNLGLASALRLSRNFALRYGVNDFISNYRGDEGIVNQVFARVGAEISF